MFHLRFGLSDHLKTLRDFVFGSRRRVKKVRIFRAWFSHLYLGVPAAKLVLLVRHMPQEDFFFLARCCLGQVPGGAPFSQRSEQATACTNRMQIRN